MDDGCSNETNPSITFQTTSSCGSVRRSQRNPNDALLTRSDVKRLVEKVKGNHPDTVVFKIKEMIMADISPAVFDQVLLSFEKNTVCQAMYIQNLSLAIRDEQLRHLIELLKTKMIWCLNIGENYEVSKSCWLEFCNALPSTNITHLYVSEHVIPIELKNKMRENIRNNRKKHDMHSSIRNIKVISRCTNMWWNPINAIKHQIESLGSYGSGAKTKKQKADAGERTVSAAQLLSENPSHPAYWAEGCGGKGAETPWTFNCICKEMCSSYENYRYHPTGPMYECTDCKVWSHTECMLGKVSNEDLEELTVLHCKKCAARVRRQNLAVLRGMNMEWKDGRARSNSSLSNCEGTLEADRCKTECDVGHSNGGNENVDKHNEGKVEASVTQGGSGTESLGKRGDCDHSLLSDATSDLPIPTAVDSPTKRYRPTPNPHDNVHTKPLPMFTDFHLDTCAATNSLCEEPELARSEDISGSTDIAESYFERDCAVSMTSPITATSSPQLHPSNMELDVTDITLPAPAVLDCNPVVTGPDRTTCSDTPALTLTVPELTAQQSILSVESEPIAPECDVDTKLLTSGVANMRTGDVDASTASDRNSGTTPASANAISTVPTGHISGGPILSTTAPSSSSSSTSFLSDSRMLLSTTHTASPQQSLQKGINGGGAFPLLTSILSATGAGNGSPVPGDAGGVADMSYYPLRDLTSLTPTMDTIPTTLSTVSTAAVTAPTRKLSVSSPSKTARSRSGSGQSVRSAQGSKNNFGFDSSKNGCQTTINGKDVAEKKSGSSAAASSSRKKSNGVKSPTGAKTSRKSSTGTTKARAATLDGSTTTSKTTNRTGQLDAGVGKYSNDSVKHIKKGPAAVQAIKSELIRVSSAVANNAHPSMTLSEATSASISQGQPRDAPTSSSSNQTVDRAAGPTPANSDTGGSLSNVRSLVDTIVNGAMVVANSRAASTMKSTDDASAASLLNGNESGISTDDKSPKTCTSKTASKQRAGYTGRKKTDASLNGSSSDCGSLQASGSDLPVQDAKNQEPSRTKNSGKNSCKSACTSPRSIGAQKKEPKTTTVEFALKSQVSGSVPPFKKKRTSKGANFRMFTRVWLPAFKMEGKIVEEKNGGWKYVQFDVGIPLPLPPSLASFVPHSPRLNKGVLDGKWCRACDMEEIACNGNNGASKADSKSCDRYGSDEDGDNDSTRSDCEDGNVSSNMGRNGGSYRFHSAGSRYDDHVPGEDMETGETDDTEFSVMKRKRDRADSMDAGSSVFFNSSMSPSEREVVFALGMNTNLEDSMTGRGVSVAMGSAATMDDVGWHAVNVMEYGGFGLDDEPDDWNL
mmetsp:Transcript_526/g.931  ORF Transcript_526/g.931 Transcript_526/m.931 type:complete len:1324 (-) Transcript_526:214-4185(-)|eukprot:CAMPEP_0185019328 /NCGR_PEP_ID=MMETSP1103-20130426/1927_1 /TAXON_ID=36769 /ORGANISM="Paraphysomonas bandaiensis, Strain Caron Lab Isolate" /LENGTH=1323 /DNA_ID=CAMNT_0027549565 /DNA_START=172 /DNA_END=4143 /DNA_ORIENTATION=+